METRARHIAVGCFMLALMVGAVIFVIWLGRYDGQSSFAYYAIRFDSDVTGLQVDGPVRYRGVTVGRVADIRIDPNNTTQIEVIAEVRSGTPIRVDSFASLEAQGITGVLYVLIDGGLQGSEMLPETSAEPYPTIRSRPGKIAALFASAPELLANASALVDRVEQMFSEENKESIAQLLNNLETLTAALALDDQGNLAGFVASAKGAADEIAAMSAEFRQLAANLDGQIGGLAGSADAAVSNFETLSTTLAATAAELQLLVAENRRPLADFTGTGLYEFTQMVTELRVLVATLTRISTQLERDPARFLLGDRSQGYEAQ